MVAGFAANVGATLIAALYHHWGAAAPYPLGSLPVVAGASAA